MDNILIRNCQFRYKCNEDWSDMDKIEELGDKVRFCRVCNKNVYLCENDDEFIEAVSKDRCVALFEQKEDHTPRLLGDVAPEYFSNRLIKKG